MSINVCLWQCVFKAANVTTENRNANIDEFVYCGFVFITDIEEGKSRAHLLSGRGIRIIIDFGTCLQSQLSSSYYLCTKR